MIIYYISSNNAKEIYDKAEKGHLDYNNILNAFAAKALLDNPEYSEAIAITGSKANIIDTVSEADEKTIIFTMVNKSEYDTIKELCDCFKFKVNKEASEYYTDLLVLELFK